MGLCLHDPDNIATTPFHLSLSYAALRETLPAQSLMSFHLFFHLPLLLGHYAPTNFSQVSMFCAFINVILSQCTAFSFSLFWMCKLECYEKVRVPHNGKENCVCPYTYLDRVKRIWYLSPMRAATVQASLRIRAVSPEPPLLAHTSSESRGTFRQKARSLAQLNGWACAVKICHDRTLEDTNSLDGAHLIFAGLLLSFTTN